MKKYLAEFIGTMVLVVLGCGSAVVHNMPQMGEGCGYLGIAFAFGLAIVAMAYSIGNVSGCHVNPAVSLAMLIRGKMETKDFIGYVVSQIIGAIVGAAIVFYLIGPGATNGYGAASNAGLGAGGAFVAEVVLTFIFLMAIIGVTSKPEYASVAGLVIGLTLVVVHIVGIPLTGTSVNPARSIGPAIFNGGEALTQLWVFIVAPLVGAALAACAYKNIETEE